MDHSDTKIKLAQNLYVRSQGTVKGLFRVGLIRNYLLLGRLSLTDEVSEDKNIWVRLGTIDALIPKEIRVDASEADQQRLQILRRREDEREKERRANRRGNDRRQPESPGVIAARGLRLQQQDKNNNPTQYYLPMGLIALIATCAGLGLYTMFAKQSGAQELTSNCSAPPQAGVNWKNCVLNNTVLVSRILERANLQGTNLQGADLHGSNLQFVNAAYAQLSSANLSYTDMSNARLTGAILHTTDMTNAVLRNADLSFADLKGALLGGVDLRGVKLSRTIWIDGSVCKIGSVGECMR